MESFDDLKDLAQKTGLRLVYDGRTCKLLDNPNRPLIEYSRDDRELTYYPRDLTIGSSLKQQEGIHSKLVKLLAKYNVPTTITDVPEERAITSMEDYLLRRYGQRKNSGKDFK